MAETEKKPEKKKPSTPALYRIEPNPDTCKPEMVLTHPGMTALSRAAAVLHAIHLTYLESEIELAQAAKLAANPIHTIFNRCKPPEKEPEKKDPKKTAPPDGHVAD